MISAFIGALVAGTICCILTPDDPNSYEKPKTYLKIPKMKYLLKQTK